MECNPSCDLKTFAAFFQHDNQAPGDPGYCEAAEATWTFGEVEPRQCAGFSGVEDARAWLENEIAMAKEDGQSDVWESLLREDIVEAVVVLEREGVMHIWDGWHRVAAGWVKGVKVPAVIGRPN